MTQFQTLPYNNNIVNQADNEFRAYLSNQTRLSNIPIQVADQVMVDWNAQKLEKLNSLAQTPNLTLDYLVAWVREFVNTGINYYMNILNQQAHQAPSCFGQQFGGYRQSAFSNSGFGTNIATGLLHRQSSSPFPASNPYANTFARNNPQPMQRPLQTTVTEKITPPQEVIKTEIKKVVEYRNPISTDVPNQNIKSKNTNIVISVLLDQMTQTEFEHVVAEFENTIFRSPEEVIAHTKKYLHRPTTNLHMLINYEKAIIFPNITKTIGQKLITSLKNVLQNASKSRHQLKYVEDILNVINTQQRGIADAIENLFVSRFNELSRCGTVTPADEEEVFTISSLNQLLRVSVNSIDDAVANSWHKIPDFKKNLERTANVAIKEVLNTLKIVDAKTESEFNIMQLADMILDKNDNILTEAIALLDSSCTEEERKLNIKQLRDTLDKLTIITVPAHAIYSTFYIDELFGKTLDATKIIKIDTLQCSGVDIESNLEYMLTQYSMTTDRLATMIVEVNNLCTIKFNVAISGDKILKLTPCK